MRSIAAALALLLAVSTSADAGRLVKIRTDKDDHFTGSLAQNAVEHEDVTLPDGLALTGLWGRCKIQSLTIISDQNLAWEIAIFSKSQSAGLSSDVDLIPYLGKWTFTAADGTQIAGTGPYYYNIEGLDLTYQDDDLTSKIHISLVNRSSTSKNAGATGEVVAQLVAEAAENY